MSGKWFQVAVMMVALPWSVPPTYALDRAMAKTTIEKSIRADTQARLADETMSAAYARLRARLSTYEQADLKTSRIEWVKQRQNRCGSEQSMAKCLTVDTSARNVVPDAWPVAVSGDPAIEAAPMHTIGASAVYPRLTRFPDAQVMAAVNVLLAGKEKADRAAYADCLSDLKDTRRKPDADTYSEDVTVRYLSRRFLSITIRASFWCGGPYPSNGAPAPVTVDLRTGREIDWKAMFKPGFLPSGDAGEHAPPSVLTKLYRTRYAADNDADCRAMVNEVDPFSSPPVLWLDVRGGLVVEPDFPHVTAACADDMALSPADLAPYLGDTALLDDLRATVKPATR